MDASGRIYEELNEDKVPTEDKARLEGYLKGRADADASERMAKKLKELRAQISELKNEGTDA